VHCCGCCAAGWCKRLTQPPTRVPSDAAPALSTSELHGLEPSVLLKALELMERDGRAELHRGPGAALDEIGVKFK
jgi:hypothetical protein